MTEKLSLKRDVSYAQIIIRYCEDIAYLVKLHGSDEIDFEENISLQYSCVFALEQIGEHIKRLSPELKDEYSEVDWNGASRLRDRIAHQYESIDFSWIRSTVLEEIPLLEKVCRSILNDIDNKKDS